nr:FHA domain-containing protein [Polyangiaceae bacterium]
MSEDDAETLLRATALSTERVGFSLQVTSECDHGATVHLDPQQPTRVLVGTGPAADLRLSDPTVSRRHVALSVLGSELRVEDLRSTNGTF